MIDMCIGTLKRLFSDWGGGGAYRGDLLINSVRLDFAPDEVSFIYRQASSVALIMAPSPLVS